MGLRESWNELGTGGKIAVGLAVGVVLLIVALVVLVVLAAVLASFVLGMGSETAEATPSASFDYDQSAGQVQIQHAAGESIPASEITIIVDGQRVFWADGGGATSGDDGEVIAGDSITVDTQPGDDVQVVYRDEGVSSTLGAETIPE